MEKIKTISEIHIKDLAKLKISEADIYFRSKEGKKFLLKTPGSLIDEAFIKKHAIYQTVFEYHQVSNHSKQEKFTELFQELKYAQFEKDVRAKSWKIIQTFKESMEENDHLLDFSLVCFSEFNALPEEILEKLYDVDESLFKKSFYAASLAVVTAMSNGFFNYVILKDFYNVTFFLDLGLCEKNYSYFIAQACNFESKLPGSGLEWLEKSGATPKEIELFKNHPFKSYELFSNKVSLAYPEFKEIILYQHELSNGTGFPRGIKKHQISSWESVVILASSILEIGDDQDVNDILVSLKNFSERNSCEQPVKKTHQKLLASLNLIDAHLLGGVG